VIAANVRAAREEAGLSQVELAAQLGVPRNYIVALERGERINSLERLRDVALALGLDLADLFDGA
jgi:transcriptional regulator with XRE-family HTH domain